MDTLENIDRIEATKAAMKAAEARLRAEFPTLDPECGCNPPEGWESLVRHLLQTLSVIRGWTPHFVTQVKSKFGGLRFYYHVPPEIEDAVRIIVQHYEGLSLTVCERCGATGRAKTERGWTRTECDMGCR